MPEAVTTTVTGRVAGDTYTQTITASGDSVERASPSVPAAKIGALTTRTDDNTGVLTMAASHGFTDAQLVDVFWSGGARRNMTIGTVSVNSVPIDGGSGDVLPADETAITAMIPYEAEFLCTGNDVVFLAAYSPVPGFIVFCTTVPADIAAATYTFTAAGSKVWVTGGGVTNPVAAVAVGKVKFSHGSTSAQTMKAIAAFT